MKKTFTLLAAAAMLATSVLAQNITSLSLGTALPLATAKMKDISGKEVSLNDAKKKNGLLVMFSCNTCPYVIKNQQRTKEIAAYALKNNIGVIVINSNEAQRSDADSYDAMKTYATAQGYNWYYTVDTDSKVANAFGATRTPEVFLFNSKGTLEYKGAIDDNPSDASAVTRQHLHAAIDEVVGGKAISVKESKSVGCTIKRQS
ncbi:Redoxin [Filimonas lacunae]|uniref:Redoxin n=1 Tax=Filimonas lacunae TaxID=477680 RepID=A0A173MJE8_9BACT|nr:thioredoxin family protein [Filimonas lacunae]BAV07599.1 alkyl hydroperoxide reductase and/or thiol-specific antioxidant family (AhpC/TSA) protein [Filimonas lacunae]SIT29830.1 Redoxin [Filimonas lacunae]